MLVGDGGGSTISVESAALETMAGQIMRVSTSTSSTRGSLGGAQGAAAGCPEPAAGAFTLLQSLLSGALGCLDECSTSLSRATSSASAAYTTTDTTQLPMSCPAGP
jgi:hypothetical protein